jgi:hypothetical protein
MTGGLIVAARAGDRMQARETYRTINRMERRRGYVRDDASGGSHDEWSYSEPPSQHTHSHAPLPPAYTEELMAIAQLHAVGILTAEEYEAKKKQLLGI